MRRRIVLMGEEVLRRRAKPVKTIDASVRRVIDDMFETMDAADGLGLAAPQVGISRRIIVVRDGDQKMAVINPTIVARSGREVAVEGCLSMPGLQGRVARAAEVTVRGLDRMGRTVSHTATGYTARCFQHEIDHLNGVLYVDHTKDLWWLEAAEDEARVDLPEGEEEAETITDDDGTVQRIVRVPTTAREALAYYQECTAAQLGTADPARATAADDDPADGAVRE